MNGRIRDNHIFYESITKNKEKLYKMAYYYLKNEQDALDALSEVTYRAIKYKKKLKEIRHLNTWITRIMINYCLDELMKKDRRRDLINKLEYEDEAYEKDNIGLSLELEEGLNAIKHSYKEVLTLRYFEECSIKEIAELLGKPEGTIKTWISRGLQNLRGYYNRGGSYNG